MIKKKNNTSENSDSNSNSNSNSNIEEKNSSIKAWESKNLSHEGSDIVIDKSLQDINCDENENIYTKKCKTNKLLLRFEEENTKEMLDNPENDRYLYPNLNDPYFNIKISQKKEFSDTKYDGTIYDVKEYADVLSNAEYELLPHQAFVRNFMSFQTPYNSLLLFHGLGSGKTCSAIGVCEEMRLYLKQMGINKKIIVVASPNVQDNFRLQLFDERKLKLVDGIWVTRGCLGNNLLKEINPTGMKGLKKEKIIQQIKQLINESYHFTGYVQFSNDIAKTMSQNDIRKLQNEYSNKLIVIDEVHNIRISNDRENKNTAKNLMYLVSVVSNIRLLLLSATPMFNSYKEIIWLINLMNMNDKRGIIGISDIFDPNRDGEFKSNEAKELFMRKLNGYVSYVRGENPYTFPFRIYPNNFNPEHTFKNIDEYPKYQINGKIIPDDSKIKKLSLFLTNIGSYQKLGYKYIISRLQQKLVDKQITKSGKIKKKDVKSMDSLNYIDLQLPIQALNIIYPYNELESIVNNIKDIELINQEEKDINDISPSSEIEDIDIIKIIDDVVTNGPEKIEETKIMSENESEPNVIDNISSQENFISKEKILDSSEKDTRNINKKRITKMKSIQPVIFDEISEEKSFKGGSERLFINARELTGSEGLRRVMNYEDSKSPAFKGAFEYKEGYENIFETNNIGKYSSKIKNICESIYNQNTNTISEGIILIYSEYIDAGLIPIALALEQMGFTRYKGITRTHSLFKNPPTSSIDVRTMKPISSKKDSDFKPATYIMITGDSRLSPNNDAEIKAITSDDNINGEKIKVVLISQAGSEGLDFKAIRQVHILEPWYNLNRIEQIIGRAVRNFSHKDLPFEQRNVQIYLYGTLLDNPEIESADLYVYRISELKAIKIGKITRLLKQISVDCLINLEQTQFTNDNFKLIKENLNVKQILSNGIVLENFEIGDIPNTATCDYMDTCEYKCLPDLELNDTIEADMTYNEKFMLINSEKIIQKIKGLMRLRFFYKKKRFNIIN
jgi:hypothetical protein